MSERVIFSLKCLSSVYASDCTVVFTGSGDLIGNFLLKFQSFEEFVCSSFFRVSLLQSFVSPSLGNCDKFYSAFKFEV